MSYLWGVWEGVEAFLEEGGTVLFVIFAVTAIMWTLIVERYLYLRFAHGAELRAAVRDWRARRDRSSWTAVQIRRMRLARLGASLHRTLPTIKTMVALCPLLGLLGTVTGMTEVFDVMAVAGNANARAMASGVSHATIPTMAGMVAALSGLFFSARLERVATQEVNRAGEALAEEHEAR